MKLFKRLLSAALAGVLALTMLAGCSAGSSAATPPSAPTDANTLGLYNDLVKCMEELHFDASLTYSQELSAIASEYAKAQVITDYSSRNAAQELALSRISTLSTLPGAVYITVSASSNYKGTTAESYKGYANTLKNALAVPYNANYVGVSVVEVNGKMCSCILFVRA